VLGLTSSQLEACLEEEIEGQDGDDGEGGSNGGSRWTHWNHDNGISREKVILLCRRASRQSGGGETMLVGLQSDEFSYVKPGLLRNWAGLQSWNYRVQSHGVKEGKTKGLRKKEDFILMFDDMTETEIHAALAQSKVSTTLAACDAKPSGAPFLLPDDIHFKADSLTSM